MCRCRCDTLAVLPVGTRLRSLRASPIGEEGYKREVTYKAIKYDRMGWVCLGTSWMNCTDNKLLLPAYGRGAKGGACAAERKRQ